MLDSLILSDGVMSGCIVEGVAVRVQRAVIQGVPGFLVQDVPGSVMRVFSVASRVDGSVRSHHDSKRRRRRLVEATCRLVEATSPPEPRESAPFDGSQQRRLAPRIMLLPSSSSSISDAKPSREPRLQDRLERVGVEAVGARPGLRRASEA